MENNLEKKWNKITESEAASALSGSTPFLFGKQEAAPNEKLMSSEDKVQRNNIPRDPRLPQDPRLTMIRNSKYGPKQPHP